MAVLRQQLVFVERMAHSGMVTPQEAGLMAEPVDTAIRVLAHRGPTWRAPLLIDVLRSLPIMRQVGRVVRGSGGGIWRGPREPVVCQCA